MFLKSIVILAVIAVSLAQVIHDGECRTDVEVVQNFNVTAYTGQWFEIQRYEVYFQKGSECCYATYTQNEDGSLALENSSIKNGNPRTSVTGTAVLVDPTADPLVGQLAVAFYPKTPGTTTNYWILGTDYDNYSIVWNCHSLRNGKSADVAWILSRTPQLNAEVQEAVDAIVDKYLIKDQLRTTIQDAETCKYNVAQDPIEGAR